MLRNVLVTKEDKIGKGWVTENCNIIAYIIREQSEEILQVVELRIKTE